MDNLGKPKEFSHENSRTFEQLVRDLFKLEYGLQNKDIFLTQMTRDGGKDVEIPFKHNSISFSPIEIVKYGLKAKLIFPNIQSFFFDFTELFALKVLGMQK